MSKYVVLDLEMCRVPYDKRQGFDYSSEIIEIGAVLLDENLNELDTFMTYVCPEYGFVDDFIEKLTGITNEHTKNAPKAKEAFDMFEKWLPEDDFKFVAWSECDETQFMHEIEHKNLSMPKLESQKGEWIDCQVTFSEKMDTDKVYKLSEALVIADIFFEDGEHDALVDSINTAKLFVKMEQEDELQLSSYYASEQVETLSYNPFADALKNFVFA